VISAATGRRIILHSDTEPMPTIRSPCYTLAFGTLTDAGRGGAGLGPPATELAGEKGMTHLVGLEPPGGALPPAKSANNTPARRRLDPRRGAPVAGRVGAARLV